METTKRKTKTFEIVMVGLCAALLCIAGPFSVPIPISPVPLSLVPLAIYIVSFLLDWKHCWMSTVVYVLLGAVGLPIFSGFSGGLEKLVGPTGGYIIGYVFMSFVCSFFISKFNKIYMYVIGMVLGIAVAYLFGTLWFTIQQSTSFVTALTLCVVPYLLGDVLKIIVAVLVGPVIKKRVADKLL